MSTDARTRYSEQQQAPPEYLSYRCLYGLLEILVAVGFHEVERLATALLLFQGAVVEHQQLHNPDDG